MLPGNDNLKVIIEAGMLDGEEIIFAKKGGNNFMHANRLDQYIVAYDVYMFMMCIYTQLLINAFIHACFYGI